LAFMVLPTGMVIFVGGSDLFPPLLRMWWNIKFGKYSRLQETAPTESSAVPTAAQLSESTSSSVVDSTGPSPNGEDFQETIVQWQPGSRVEIFIDPPNLWSLIFVSGIVGMLAGLFGGFLLGVTVVEGVGFRGEDERAKFFGLFSVISVLVGGYLFLSTRLTHRASRTVLDWDTNILDAHREFSFSWQGSLNDIQSLIVRCEPTKGRKRRYRATVELDVVGKQFITARTANVRRKPTAARDDALTLAEPLAAELEVPVRLEGWEEMDGDI